jgi:outer membrane lipoprotein-sorting protein
LTDFKNAFELVKAAKTVEEANLDVTTTFSNYQKTDIGYVMPFATTISMSNGVTVSMTVTKVVVNQEIDPKIFEKPE